MRLLALLIINRGPPGGESINGIGFTRESSSLRDSDNERSLYVLDTIVKLTQSRLHLPLLLINISIIIQSFPPSIPEKFSSLDLREKQDESIKKNSMKRITLEDVCTVDISRGYFYDRMRKRSNLRDKERERGNEVWIYRIEAWSALMAGARKTLVGTVGHVGGQWLGHKYPGVRFRASR